MVCKTTVSGKSEACKKNVVGGLEAGLCNGKDVLWSEVWDG